MKKILQLEQLAQLAVCIVLIYSLPLNLSWWAYLVLFFSPDLSIAAYAVNARIGALVYNFAHFKMVAGILIISGHLLSENHLLLAGLLMWGHSSFDRMLGYGLKYDNSFRHTHLGLIGKK